MADGPFSLEAQQAALFASRGIAGAPHLMGPGVGEVHIDRALSNLAVRYRPNAGKMIADRVVPVVGVQARSGKYHIFAEGTHSELNNANIASQQGQVARIHWSVSNDSYAVEDFGLLDFVPTDVEAQADAPISPLMDSTEILVDRLTLHREYRAAAVVFGSSNYGGQTSGLTGGNRWNNPTSDPVRVIDTAMSNVNLKTTPNVAVMGKAVWDALKRHPAILAHILSRSATRSGATPLTVTRELFAEAFELDDVIVGEARYNSAAPGATAAQTRIWGNHFALLTTPATPRLGQVQAFAYTLRYTRAGSTAIEVRRWNDPGMIGVAGGTYVKATFSETIKPIGGGNVGYLLTDVVD